MKVGKVRKMIAFQNKKFRNLANRNYNFSAKK